MRRPSIESRLLLYPMLALLSVIQPLGAQALKERALPLDATLDENGAWIQFSWPKATGKRVQRTRIERRLLGETGKYSWQFLDTTRQIVRLYRDESIQPGLAYEYRISRPSEEQVESGYWVAGLRVPAEERRGVALVVVDETVAEPLTQHLDRFALDLVGDGWNVVVHRVPRGNDKNLLKNFDSARQLRSWIRKQYNAAPDASYALILVGQVPVVKSGRSQPDGHAIRAFESDLFYADVDGEWRDNGVGGLAHNNIPGDHIEMQVGRIDYSHMNDSFDDEISLLKRYFDKNHHWRHAQLGDPRHAYGSAPRLFVENAALRNIVGPENVASGGHHDTGKSQSWLFGVDFGSSDFDVYAEGSPIRAIFTINFGSYKLEFSKWNNHMKAIMAQRWFVLATGWGARPAWQLHHMAMGKSIGYSHLRTVNNGQRSKGGYITLEYTSTGQYPWVNPIWINLLGDPTLYAFPLQPVRHLRASAVDGGVQLDWDADEPGDRQYRIYRAADRLGPYRALNPDRLHDGTRYLDSAPIPGGWYMVRAHGLKEVYAGSFYRYSQGRFASLDNQPPVALDQAISTPPGEAVDIRPAASDADPGDRLLLAPVKGPAGGYLLPDAEGWRFVPAKGFSGQVTIPFSVYDGLATDEGRITVDVQ